MAAFEVIFAGGFSGSPAVSMMSDLSANWRS
jgi:hypothetical protein